MIITYIMYYNPNDNLPGQKPSLPPSYDEDVKKKLKHRKPKPKPVGLPDVTTLALGEEGGGISPPPIPISPPGATTEAVGEEGGIAPPPLPIDPPRITTLALGEEGGIEPHPIGPPEIVPVEGNVIKDPFIAFNTLETVVQDPSLKKGLDEQF